MTALFLKLVNMSITASWLVAAVILLRWVLKKAPRSLHCGLWALVAIRLVCPFSLESSFSLLPQQEPVTIQTFQTEEITPSPSVTYEVVPEIAPNGKITYSEPVMVVNHTGAPFSALLPTYLTWIWLAGMGLMLLYTLESYLRIRQTVAPSVAIGNDVYICDHIQTPFILGVIRPRIYIPSCLESGDADYVLAHERAHLKRKDHWWKPFGFLLLSIYWFNPVLWLAYILLCRDIELACDEKVVQDMDAPAKKAYSTALLNCSLPRLRIMACPLAFGEVGVKARVKNVLHYQKPAFWVVMIAVVLCIIAAAGLLTDPTGIHLYEIDDSRNYSDLLSNTEDVTLIIEEEHYPVYDEAAILEALDEITVRKFTLNRSRSEDRDKTNRIHLRGNTYLNFSWDCSHVWIDNGVKPTYTYRVIQPKQVREIFDTMKIDVLAGLTDTLDQGIPEEVLSEGYRYFDPQFYGDSLYLGAYKDRMYCVLRFEKNEQGRYDYQDIHPFLTENIWNTSLSVCRIPYPDGERMLLLVKNKDVSGLCLSAIYFNYIQIPQTPSIVILNQSTGSDAVIRPSTEIPPTIEISLDGSPVFRQADPDAEDLYYLYMDHVCYYDGMHKPGSYSLDASDHARLIRQLEQVPEGSFVPCEKPQRMPLYTDLTVYASNGKRQQWHQIVFSLHHTGEEGHLILYAGQDAIAFQDPKYYRITDEALNEYLISLCDDSKREITIATQDIDNPIVYTHGDVTIRVIPFWNWEYEVIEYTDEETPFGIRGRPKNQDTGWIFYSCWPGGFESSDPFHHESFMGGAYPDDAQWRIQYIWHYREDPDLDPTGERIWSSAEITNIPGNFVIVNDGADPWFADHHNEIGASWSIDTFQIGS